MTEEAVIARRLNRLIRSGEPFTVDQVWRDSDEFRPGDHRNWLGVHVRRLADADAIVPVGWRETSRSTPHSRPARLWRGKVAA